MTYYADQYLDDKGKLKKKPYRDGCVPTKKSGKTLSDFGFTDDKDGSNLQSLIDHRNAQADPQGLKLTGAVNPAYPASKSWKGANKVGNVWNQGQTNSCVGHALAAMMWGTRVNSNQANPLSRQFIYWAAREAQGVQNQDNGCNVGVAWTELKNKGACLGNQNDFLGAGFNYQAEIMTKPSPAKYAEAANRKLINGVFFNSEYNGSNPLINYADERGAQYGERSEYIRHLLQYLPVFIAFRLISQHYTAPGGYLQYPSLNYPSTGGHAVLITGYDNATRQFEFKNSWGTGWGNQGYGYMSYDHVNAPGLTYDVTYGWNMTA